MKTCSCGIHYKALPSNTIFAPTAAAPGWYFNCACGSTLFMSLKKTIERALAVKATHLSTTQTPDQGPVSYDIRAHGRGTRVVELRSGRRGTVAEIRETRADWIEPIIQWDGEGELSRATWGLILEGAL
jgi:hypothetical protein